MNQYSYSTSSSSNSWGRRRNAWDTHSRCPGLSMYAAMHLDTMVKIINHILMLMLIFNIFLFVSSWSVSALPNGVGFQAIGMAFVLNAHNVCVWLIINNNRISALSFLAPTEFMVGVALGTTMGATLLALILSQTFKTLTHCNKSNKTDLRMPTVPFNNNHTNTSGTNTYNAMKMSETNLDPIYAYLCQEHHGAMTAVWFWSGLVFWLNFCLSLLLAVGRHEITQCNLEYYDPVSVTDPGADPPRQGNHQQQPRHGMTVEDYERNYAQQEHGPAQAATSSQPSQRSQYSTATYADLNNGPAFPGDFVSHQAYSGQGKSSSKSTATAPSSSFVGDYDTIPEIRPDTGVGARSERRTTGPTQNPLNEQMPIIDNGYADAVARITSV